MSHLPEKLNADGWISVSVFFVEKRKHILHRKTILRQWNLVNCIYRIQMMKRIDWCQRREVTLSSLLQQRSLQWHHNNHDGVSNYRCLDCLLNRLFRRCSKKRSKLRVTDLFCVGNSPLTGEFPTQRANNAENVSIWWGHHDLETTSDYWCTYWCGISAHISGVL